MHVIQERAVVRDGQIVIRPMMYIALTYDHRIVDGREAATFLKRIKECVEAPSRMLLAILARRPQIRFQKFCRGIATHRHIYNSRRGCRAQPLKSDTHVNKVVIRARGLILSS